MNMATSLDPLRAAEQRTSASLIRRCALSPEDVARITAAGQAQGLRFCEAALRLGLVSREDVDAVQSWDGKVMLVTRKAKPDPRLVLAHDPYGPRGERFRALRTELLLRRPSPCQADTIAVLSPCAGEGRSQLAAELAIAFAQLGRPTLLVDADLRHARQQALFGTDGPIGLTDALASGATPYLHPVEGVPHLALLAAGSALPNPQELLSDERFEKLIEEWRQQYAYIVFDTPPVSAYSDGLAVARLAGRVLAVNRAAHTPYVRAREMLRRLSATQAVIVGAVINHF
ncbi:MAG: CpsD/CapB family tyrosine-protein kinase [Nevskia sp.]|nr:CpsD/CapB family tyrosine-protein kinase [Nevskia sp.]